MKIVKVSDVIGIINSERANWDHHAVSSALENIKSDLEKAKIFENLPAGSWFRHEGEIFFKREDGSYVE